MTLFTTVDPRPIHFMGIAGAGMSGLALLAKEQAVAITGCDNDPTGAADLAANGVEIWRGHDPRHVAGGRGGVGTPAGPGDHPARKGEDNTEIQATPQPHIPLFSLKKKK